MLYITKGPKKKKKGRETELSFLFKSQDPSSCYGQKRIEGPNRVAKGDARVIATWMIPHVRH